MQYKTFSRLYDEALEYNDLDLYIAERGWQDWMDDYDPDDVGNVLKTVYAISNMDFKQLREYGGYKNRQNFVRDYTIPDRTVQSWDYDNKLPEYNKKLITYSIFMGGESNANKKD